MLEIPYPNWALLLNFKYYNCFAFINPSAISFAIEAFKFQLFKFNYFIFLKSLNAFPIIVVILLLKLTFLKQRTFKSGNHLSIIFNLN